MKKLVTDYVKTLGGTTSYSGNKKTMYITQPKSMDVIDEFEMSVLNTIGFSLPFTLKTNYHVKA